MARWVQPTGEPLALNAVSGFTTCSIGPIAVGGALDWWVARLAPLSGRWVYAAPLPPREPYGWRRNKGRVQLVCKKLGSGRALDE